jgi:hypothetical protein
VGLADLEALGLGRQAPPRNPSTSLTASPDGQKKNN